MIVVYLSPTNINYWEQPALLISNIYIRIYIYPTRLFPEHNARIHRKFSESISDIYIIYVHFLT